MSRIWRQAGSNDGSACRGRPCSASMPAIRVPTLIVHGTEDRQVPFAAAEYLATHIPGAQLYAFKGYGHVPLFTATQEFCQVLRRFVRSGVAAVPRGPTRAP